jgi:hypothetical protein
MENRPQSFILVDSESFIGSLQRWKFSLTKKALFKALKANAQMRQWESQNISYYGQPGYRKAYLPNKERRGYCRRKHFLLKIGKAKHYVKPSITKSLGADYTLQNPQLQIITSTTKTRLTKKKYHINRLSNTAGFSRVKAGNQLWTKRIIRNLPKRVTSNTIR